MPANIRFWRKGDGVDSGINTSRFDLVPNDECFIENVNPGSSNQLQCLWTPKDGLGIVLVAEVWETRQGWSFTVPSACKVGSYRFRLTVDDTSVIRQFGLSTPIFGPGGIYGSLQIPALGARANPEVSLLNRDAAADEMSRNIDGTDDPRFPAFKTDSGYYLTYEKLIHSFAYAWEVIESLTGNALQIQGRPILNVDPHGYGDVTPTGPSAPAGSNGQIVLSWNRISQAWEPFYSNALYIAGRKVASTAPTTGQTLVWDNGFGVWKPGSVDGGGSFSGDATSLRSRNISSVAPTDGQILSWDAAENHWEPRAPAAGGSDATQLQGRNLDSSAPTDGQVIAWDATDNRWEPKTPVPGGSNATQIQGRNVSSTAPTAGQALLYDGSTWSPSNISSSSSEISAGKFAAYVGHSVTNVAAPGLVWGGVAALTTLIDTVNQSISRSNSDFTFTHSGYYWFSGLVNIFATTAYVGFRLRRVSDNAILLQQFTYPGSNARTTELGLHGLISVNAGDVVRFEVVYSGTAPTPWNIPGAPVDGAVARSAVISIVRLSAGDQGISSADKWTKLADIDLTTFSNQAITAGRNIINGYEYWTRYRAGFSTMEVLAGVGLRMVSSADSWGGSYPAAGNIFNGINLPVDQIPGFDPLEPFLAQVHIESSVPYVNNGPSVLAAVQKFPPASTPTAELVAESSVATDGAALFSDSAGSPRAGAFLHTGTATTSITVTRTLEMNAPSILTAKDNYGDMDFAVELRNENARYFLGNKNCHVDDLVPYADIAKTQVVKTRRENRRPCVAIAVHGSAPVSLDVKRIRIYQRTKPGIATGWIRATDVNFMSLSAVTINDGTNTIGGLTVVGQNLASGASSAGVTSNGITINCNAVSTDFTSTTRTAPNVSIALDSLLPITWNSQGEICVYGQVVSNADANYEFVRFGLETRPATASVRHAWLRTTGYFNANTASSEEIRGGSSSNTPAVVANQLFCLVRKANGDVYYYSKSVSGLLDSDSNEKAFAAPLSEWTLDAVFRDPKTLLSADEKVKLASDLQIVFAASTANTAGAHTAWLKRLRVEYIHGKI